MLKICIAFGQAFKDAAMEYTRNTSLGGFNLLYYIRRKKYQRLFWIFFLIAGIIGATYITFESINNIFERPIVTTLESNQYSIKKVPFPAVAICSANKLSRSALNDFVEEMRHKHNPPLSHEKFLQKMKLFAGLFDSGSVDSKEAVTFQKEFLDKQNINITETLRKLAPKCEDLILKCRWATKLHECETLFSQRFTANGYCCTFNYIRTSEDKTLDKLKYPIGHGFMKGLTLLLNTSTRDYFITDRSFFGFTLQIFNYGDFPDSSIGSSVQEAFIPQGSEIMLKLSAILQSATSELSMYNIDQRRCIMFGEIVGGYNKGYSRDACMTRSILNTYSLFGGGLFTPQSNLSLDCPACLPLCNFNFYVFRKVISSLKDTHLLWENKQFLKLISNEQINGEQLNFSYEALTTLMRNTEDLSLVRIFFDSPYAVRFSKQSLYSWYEILSIIGGIIGIFMGGSLISAIEVIYFFVLKFTVGRAKEIFEFHKLLIGAFCQKPQRDCKLEHMWDR
ncbi:pickpocket protein 28 [Ceratitis capitata]|uniref:pickpocket protein 28 n=1 Tax=Ceratitis capitata TaxID=7213 RepID=UPI000A10D9AD|nr:pickpocket protein 28 [Ceratitis capitata]